MLTIYLDTWQMNMTKSLIQRYSSETHQVIILGWTSVAAACCSVISLPPSPHFLFLIRLFVLKTEIKLIFFHGPFLKLSFLYSSNSWFSQLIK